MSYENPLFMPYVSTNPATIAGFTAFAVQVSGKGAMIWVFGKFVLRLGAASRSWERAGGCIFVLVRFRCLRRI